jgi:uncharacterized protein
MKYWCYGALALMFWVGQVHAAESGLLWKMQAPNGVVSYLLGTMHSDDRRINVFSPVLLQALQSSEAFMLETLPPDDTSIFSMPNASLLDMLTESELARVRELADFHSMDTDAVMHMKPWLLAVIFDLPKPQTPYAQDTQLMTMAEDQGKSILGLEDNAEHFGVLDSFSLDEQLVMLRAVLKRTQQAKERNFEAMVKAYLKGDVVKLAALDEAATSTLLPKALWHKMRAELIDERNEKMAQRLTNQASQQAVFVAVGAAHLPGKQGLLVKLRKAGFILTPVQQ